MNLSDIETGYKAFTRPVISALRIEECGFGVEPEITAKIAALGCRIYEVPIDYVGRRNADGKKINWRDGVVSLWVIVKYGLRAHMGTRTQAANGDRVGSPPRVFPTECSPPVAEKPRD